MKSIRVVFALALLAAPVNADERLQIRVGGIRQFAPADMLVQAIVERSADNRAIEVVAESDDFYRSSMMQLDGERAPRVMSVSFSQMPAGAYDVTVQVLAADGKVLASANRLVRLW
jgi:hypothetical protein